MRRMYDENEIKSIASESGGGKLYYHEIYATVLNSRKQILIYFINSGATPLENGQLSEENTKGFVNGYIYDETNSICSPIIRVQFVDKYKLRLVYIKNNFAMEGKAFSLVPYGSSTPFDTVTEL